MEIAGGRRKKGEERDRHGVRKGRKEGRSVRENKKKDGEKTEWREGGKEERNVN